MAQVTGVVLPNNGDRIKTENYNDPITKILAQVNGGLDSANITPGSLAWESMASFTNKIPAAAMQDSGNAEKFRSEGAISFVASGLIWSSLTGLNGTMTSGFIYSTLGTRLSVASIASRAFTASKDTYAYVTSAGVIGYSEVANNATPPTQPAGSLWLAKVVTSGTAITSAVDMRPLAPIAYKNIELSSFPAPVAVGGGNIVSDGTTPRIIVTTDFSFTANTTYLLLYNVQQTSFSAGASVWQFNLQVNGVNTATTRGENTGQQGTTIVGIFTPTTTGVQTVRVQAERLTGTALLTVEVPVITIIPLLYRKQ